MGNRFRVTRCLALSRRARPARVGVNTRWPARPAEGCRGAPLHRSLHPGSDPSAGRAAGSAVVSPVRVGYRREGSQQPWPLRFRGPPHVGAASPIRVQLESHVAYARSRGPLTGHPGAAR